MSGDPQVPPRWALTLYVSGASPRSAEAVRTVQHLCQTELAGRADLQIVDVNDAPEMVLADRIVAVPTLVKRLPEPPRQLVGDLSDSDRLRSGLDLGRISTHETSTRSEAGVPRDE